MHDDYDPPPPTESALRMEAVRYTPDGRADRTIETASTGGRLDRGQRF